MGNCYSFNFLCSSGLLYWNSYGNNGVAGRLEYILPEEGAGGGGEAAGSTQKLFYLKDHLGSTRAVMSTNGAVVESYDYYPFGLKMESWKDFIPTVAGKATY